MTTLKDLKIDSIVQKMPLPSDLDETMKWYDNHVIQEGDRPIFFMKCDGRYYDASEVTALIDARITELEKERKRYVEHACHQECGDRNEDIIDARIAELKRLRGD